MKQKRRSTMTDSRQGLVLIICMLVVAFTSTLSLGILRTQACRLQLASNIKDHAQAEALAEAGIEHGIAALLGDALWRGDSGWLTLGPDSSLTYRFLVEADGDGVRILSTGRCGDAEATKELQHAF